ncbi:CRE-LIN-8 protein [Caenorhabditis remanei]|uniref:CRE-LIN-8 protein n=1 Tax=Caenorhabditis remanei TaxID=31234 RepID=E3M0W3_CAERE|nr:CRE-LIN-8 protein [Caenorhabditis remanei]
MSHGSSSSPPIAYHKLPPLLPLPTLPGPDPSRKLDFKDYCELLKVPGYQFDEVDQSNEVMKKVVLSEIEKRPEVWSSRKGSSIQKTFPMIAVATFKRTGVLLSVPSIKSVYKCAKDNLRNRLRIAICRHKLSPEAVEKYMWRWDFYGFIRFYREHTQHWEAELYKEMAGGGNSEYVEEPKRKQQKFDPEEIDFGITVEEEPYEDFDLIYDEKPLVEQSPYPQDHSDLMSYFQSGLQSANTSNFLEKINSAASTSQKETNNGMSGTDCDSSSTVIPPSALNDFSEEMKQIAYQANRIAREQPESIKILRRTLFDVVLAFDDKKYKSAGELYRELAEKNPR